MYLRGCSFLSMVGAKLSAILKATSNKHQFKREQSHIISVSGQQWAGTTQDLPQSPPSGEGADAPLQPPSNEDNPGEMRDTERAAKREGTRCGGEQHGRSIKPVRNKQNSFTQVFTLLYWQRKATESHKYCRLYSKVLWNWHYFHIFVSFRAPAFWDKGFLGVVFA